MTEPAISEEFSTWEDVTNFVVFGVFLALAFNWFADLGWFAPYDGQTFGAVFMGTLFWGYYALDRVALMKEGRKPTAWRYAVAGIGAAATFYIGTVIL